MNPENMEAPSSPIIGENLCFAIFTTVHVHHFGPERNWSLYLGCCLCLSAVAISQSLEAREVPCGLAYGYCMNPYIVASQKFLLLHIYSSRYLDVQYMHTSEMKQSTVNYKVSIVLCSKCCPNLILQSSVGEEHAI